MTRINWVMPPPPSITYRECVRDVVARPCTFLFILIVHLSIFCFERFFFFFMSVSSPRIKRGNFIFEKLMWRGSPASRNGARDLNFLLLAYTGVQCCICIYRNPLWRLILHLLSSSLLKTTFPPDQGETFASAYMLCVGVSEKEGRSWVSLTLHVSLLFHRRHLGAHKVLLFSRWFVLSFLRESSFSVWGVPPYISLSAPFFMQKGNRRWMAGGRPIKRLNTHNLWVSVRVCI